MNWPDHRKRFMRFRARAVQNTIELTAFKSSAFFGSPEDTDGPMDLRVYRLSLPGFQFGLDYKDYIDGISVDEAQLVMNVSVNPKQNRKISIYDNEASTNRTYAYWLESVDANARPVGPRGVKLRHPEVWWGIQRIRHRIDNLQKNYPHFLKQREVGRTPHDQPISGIYIGSQDPMVAAVGAIHGGESGPELLIPAVEQLLEKHRDLLERVGLALLPVINIDERERQVAGCPWYLRTNPHGVDLNRNFDANWSTPSKGYGQDSTDPDGVTYRGPQPESEPETRAVIEFLESADPVAVFSYHWMAGITGGKCVGPECVAEGEFKQGCKDVVHEFNTGIFGPDEPIRITFEAAPGSLPWWVYDRFGVPAFDVEGHTDYESLVRARTDGTTPMDIEEWQQRHLQGLKEVLRHIDQKEN